MVIGDVLDNQGQALAVELGPAASFVRHDVTSEADWARAVEAAQKLGGLHGLVNNAGIYQPAALMETDDALWQRHIQINQYGCFLGMKAVVPAMERSGGGSIVNISSVAGLKGSPGSFAYAATKWALRGMTKSAAIDTQEPDIPLECRRGVPSDSGTAEPLQGRPRVGPAEAEPFDGGHHAPRCDHDLRHDFDHGRIVGVDGLQHLGRHSRIAANAAKGLGADRRVGTRHAVLSRLAPFPSGANPRGLSWSRDLHHANCDASVTEEATASAGCWNVLVVTGSAAEEVAEFIVLSAEPLGRVMLLEATHTSDPSFDPAMVLFKSIIQVDARPVADVAAQRRADCAWVGVMPVGCHPVRHKTGNGPCRAEEPLGRSHVTGRAQHRVDEVPVAIDRPIQVAPATMDLEVGFVDVPTLARAASCAVTPLAQRLTHHGQ